MRKLIHLRRQDSAPLPGDTAPDFFEAWLRYGTGGTCWAGNGALQSLLLDETAASAIEHPAWGVSCAMREGHWIIRWRPLHVLDGIDCRIERLQVTAQSFHEAHAGTRAWSPFNYALYARSSRGDAVFGTAFGQRVEVAGDGSVRRSALPPPPSRPR